jgi:hypothetical protein
MKRFKEHLMPFVIILTAVFVITLALLSVANLVFPGLSAQAGLSFGEVGSTLGRQAGVVTQLTGLSPLTDLILFAAAYIFVCIILWIQAELRTYLASRGHFK